MEIGFSNDQLIDVALNAAGFMLAGMLLLMIRSLFRRGTRVAAPVTTEVETPVLEAAPAVEERRRAPVSEGDPEFVDLNIVKGAPSQNTDTNITGSDFKLRNRREIIQLAKKMLTGNENSEEAGSLPITDGELSMIKQRLNLQGAGRNE